MKRIQIGTAIAEGPGIAQGMLRVGQLPEGYPMEIPVVIAQGENEGPTVWLHGCVHGNEYCGAYAIHALLRGLKPAELSGAVVALPVLNITGFQRNQRMSPFEGYSGGDLNRCFPGRSNGTLTEQMAFHIYRHLKEYADYFIDFHTAFTPDTRWALFAPPAGELGRKAEGMARAFGFSSTLPTPMDILGGSALIAAAKDGIPGLIVEAGGIGASFSMETAQEVAERLRNVLRQLKMLPGDVAPQGPMTFFSNFAWVNATRGGLFRPVVACGQSIREGDVVGRYYDVYGDLVEEAKSAFSGIVLAICPGPVMPAGEILVHVGLDPTPA